MGKGIEAMELVIESGRMKNHAEGRPTVKCISISIASKFHNLQGLARKQPKVDARPTTRLIIVQMNAPAKRSKLLRMRKEKNRIKYMV